MSLPVRFVLMALFVSIMGIAFAGDEPEPTGSDAFNTIGKCAPKARVKLAHSPGSRAVCVNGYATRGYPDWGPSRDADEPGAPPPDRPTRLQIPEDGALQIVKADPGTRKVLVKTTNGKFWVGAEALECDARNLGAYCLPPLPPLPSPYGACPVPPKPPMDTDVLKHINREVTDKNQAAILARAADYQQALHDKVANDMTVLHRAYDSEDSTDESRYAILKNAYKRISEQYKRAALLYKPDCSQESFPKAFEIDVERGQRSCRTFRYTYNVLKGYFDPPKPVKEVLASFEGRLVSAHYKEGDELEDTFKDSKKFGEMLFDNNATNNQLVARNAIYYGMDLDSVHRNDIPPDVLKKRLELRSKLKLVDPNVGYFNSVEHSQGLSTKGVFDELHNGYLYGATGKPGDPIECAGFALNYVLGMQRKADPNGGKGSIPTVWDFENIHKALTGEGGTPPYFSEYTSCFKVVDVRANEPLQPADFIASHGHVAIVNKYNPDTREVDTIESASGTCGSVCYTRRPLFEPACVGDGKDEKADDWTLRPMRSDLRVLRFSPHGSCPIKKLKNPQTNLDD